VIPKGFEIEDKTRSTHVLKLVKNLYGQKQAGRVWNQHLHGELLDIGWRQSKIDECLYYKGNVMFVVYVDDGILVYPSQDKVNEELEILKKRFTISVEGTLSDYVGVNIEWTEDGRILMTQPNMIRSILKEMNFNEDTKERETPAYSSTVLKDGKNNEGHKADWHYRRIIGKLNFLSSSCRPDIACAVHQAARFSADPRINHTEAVRRLARYLKGNVDRGIIMNPTEHSFEIYVDADFGGLWDKETAEDDPTTAKSRTGYVVLYAGCPVIWASTLQSEFAMSTTEAEYLAMSTALRHALPIMRLVKEIKKRMVLDQ
jgi:Reverse transcriptase (RNA-dependent DNA polymerase)